MADEEQPAEGAEKKQEAAKDAGEEGAARDAANFVLDSLDLARGEVNDEDLDALEAAVNSVDLATRNATPERLERLTALQARLADIAAQIREGRRRPMDEPPALTADELQRYQQLVDEGVAAGERGDLHTALQTLEDAVRTNPDGMEGLFNLGVVYGLVAHKNITKAEFYDDYTRDEVFVERAQICYDKVLEHDANHLPSLNNLATLYSMRDNREAAVPLLKRIVEITPETEEEKHIVAAAQQQLDELESI